MNIETGNALADYILNGRPESNDVHVFIKSLAPYDRILDGGAVGKRILKNIMQWMKRLQKNVLAKRFIVSDVVWVRGYQWSKRRYQ